MSHQPTAARRSLADRWLDQPDRPRRPACHPDRRRSYLASV